jgi:flagellar protein FlaG
VSAAAEPTGHAPVEVKTERVAVTAAPEPKVRITPVGVEAVHEAAQQISEYLRKSAPNIEFVVDNAAQEVIVRIVDAETKRLIRQIPSEEALAIARALHRQGGLFLRQTA